MSKLVLSYENGIEKKELSFLGKTFDYSMIPNDSGSKSDKPGFDTQIELEDEIKNLPDEVLEALGDISFADNDEILDCLEILDSFEKLKM